MTTNTLANIVRWMNERRYPDQFFVTPGSAPVRRGRVWMPMRPASRQLFKTYAPHDMWFVFEAERCVAAVYDMVGDLHVYTHGKYRRRGIMFTALTTTVFPTLAREGRKEQRVEYRSSPAANLLRKLQATFVDTGYAHIDLRRYKAVKSAPVDTLPLSAVRRSAMRDNLLMAAEALQMAIDEYHLTTGAKMPRLQRAKTLISNTRDELVVFPS